MLFIFLWTFLWASHNKPKLVGISKPRKEIYDYLKVGMWNGMAGISRKLSGTLRKRKVNIAW